MENNYIYNDSVNFRGVQFSRFSLVTRLAHGVGVYLEPVGVRLVLGDPLHLVLALGLVPYPAGRAEGALLAVPGSLRDLLQTNAVDVVAAKQEASIAVQTTVHNS